MFDKPFSTRRTNYYKGSYILEQKEEISPDTIIELEKAFDNLLQSDVNVEVGFLAMREIAEFQIDRADSLGGLNSSDAPPLDENFLLYNRACVIENKSDSSKRLYIAKEYFESYGYLLKQHNLENSNSRVLSAGVMIVFSKYPELYLYLDDDGFDISIAKEVSKFGVLIMSDQYDWENIDKDNNQLLHVTSSISGRNSSSF
jgi:hypothetical protein